MRLTLLILGVVFLYSCADPSSAIPRVDISKFQPAVRAQIEPAFRAAQENPRDADRVGTLGMLLEAYRQDEAATKCYEHAHQLAPDTPKWAYLLGRIKAAAGHSAEAIPVLGAVMNYTPAIVALGNALLNENRPAEAIRSFENALRLDQKYAAAHYGLGRAYSQAGDVAKAVKHHQIACNLFSSYGAAHYALAQILRKQGDSEGADRELREYEKNKTAVPPEDDPFRREVNELNAGAMMHLRKSAELEQAGRIDDAAAEQEQALQIDPTLVQAHVNLISLYGKLGQFSQADMHFHKAVEINPKQADAYYNYGVLLFRRKQTAEAERAFQDALQRNPYHAQAHHNLGFLYEQQGRLGKALTEYELATSNQADYRLAHFHAGRILANQQRYDAAIGHLLKSLTAEDENTPAYLYALAATYARAGNPGEAKKFAARARAAAISMGQSGLIASIDRDFGR